MGELHITYHFFDENPRRLILAIDGRILIIRTILKKRLWGSELDLTGLECYPVVCYCEGADTPIFRNRRRIVSSAEWLSASRKGLQGFSWLSLAESNALSAFLHQQLLGYIRPLVPFSVYSGCVFVLQGLSATGRNILEVARKKI